MSLHSIRNTFLTWTYLVRLITLIIGLFICALGIIFTYQANMGLDPWNVLHQGISMHTPLSFGTASIVLGALLILAGFLIKLYPGVGTIINMILIGSFTDLLLRLNWIPDLTHASLVIRLLATLMGIFCVGLGTAIYTRPKMGAGPRDGLMLHLSTLTKKRIAIISLAFQGSALIIGFLLGGNVGIGTLIYALAVGPAVEINLLLVKKVYALAQHSCKAIDTLEVPIVTIKQSTISPHTGPMRAV